MSHITIQGNVVDVLREEIFFGEIEVEKARIKHIRRLNDQPDSNSRFILPGFIDSHVHIESSMLVPAEFARLAVVHGTVATVSDPHEIANVCGVDGINYMIRNGELVNFKFNFGAPSCVPATNFETAGDEVGVPEIKRLLSDTRIKYLSEMMNFPGVINNDEQVMQKIAAAHEASKPIDGHAPALRGEALSKYISAGISTDHECFTQEEALEKLSLGMKIIIREGSAARNFDALIDLLHDYPNEIMFCSDDKHPDSLVAGHINLLCSRAIARGIDIFKVLKAACTNPVMHYALDVGMLRAGDPADFIIVTDLTTFSVQATYINGELVSENGKTLIPTSKHAEINRFLTSEISPDSLNAEAVRYVIDGRLPVIEALDGQLVTNRLMLEPLVVNEKIMSDPARDVLKIVVINRYHSSPPAIAFVKNFGLKEGAIASSVAHDSHNIIAVGVSDNMICEAVNLVIRERGGISAYNGVVSDVLPLPVAGLMSSGDGYAVGGQYTRISELARSFGSTLAAPFMTLSFMALLVIPSLKLSDKGLFDGNSFRFVYG
jgi:adenine deaminase